MYFFKEEYSIIKKVLLRDNSSKRIGIARLLYNNPQIRTLEDGTSNHNHATEVKIINNLINTKNIKLLITIAHRLVASKRCDLLLFFKNEEIEDKGTWMELNKRNQDFKIFN